MLCSRVASPRPRKKVPSIDFPRRNFKLANHGAFAPPNIWRPERNRLKILFRFPRDSLAQEPPFCLAHDNLWATVHVSFCPFLAYTCLCDNRLGSGQTLSKSTHGTAAADKQIGEIDRYQSRQVGFRSGS
ncbi:hypothetical protein BJX68DRAFT_204822 [Aspergillus pseudodeflectus]|uniref:Uncharacterized protein n=1 Tax=Aspergillus pseudodeflectus TaxID=176178 RepID=A0ABR4KVD5_9EURO